MNSIRLRPQGSQERMLQSLIDRNAEEHRTMSFRPHLTICEVPGDLSALDAAAAYIAGCGLLPLTVAKTAVTGTVINPYRAVFIEVENTPALREFRERLRDIFRAPPLIPPHISLLYRLDRVTRMPRPDLDTETLAAIAARCVKAIEDRHFTLSWPIANGGGGAQIDLGTFPKTKC